MRWHRASLLTIGCLALIFSGCMQAKRNQPLAPSAEAPPPAYPADAAMPLPHFTARAAPVHALRKAPTRAGADDVRLASADLPKSQPDRVLIYTATLQMAVADVEVSLTAVQKLGEETGGYLQRMTTDSVTIRIPAAKFRDVLEKLRSLGQTVGKQIEVQDVTDEYVDLQLRLKNAESLMQRLNGLLAKAETMKETLEIEREMSRLREDIERIKGRLTNLDRQISYSTITVNFVKASAAVVVAHRPETPFPWVDELGVEQVLRIRERGE